MDPITNVVRYKKKSLAEHGAASRAYDCHSFRANFSTGGNSIHLGIDAQYCVDLSEDLFGESLEDSLR